MEKRLPIDLNEILNHGDAEAVRRFVLGTFSLAYPQSDTALISTAFSRTKDLFEGRFPGYAACRTGYHDYRHTLDVLVAATRLIDGGVLLGRGLDPVRAEDTLLAALLHDVGYIQEVDDEEGTGAKYTKIHVQRSANFIRKYAPDFLIDGARALRIARIILATDLALGLDSIGYSDQTELTAAEILASADLLGQMADRMYLEKLLFLYYEFKEAGYGGYETSFDVLRKTASFYTSIAARLDGPLATVSFDAREHFSARLKVDHDLYRESIDHQMAYLDQIMRDDSINYRRHLRRADIEKAERAEEARLKALGVEVVP